MKKDTKQLKTQLTSLRNLDIKKKIYKEVTLEGRNPDRVREELGLSQWKFAALSNQLSQEKIEEYLKDKNQLVTMLINNLLKFTSLMETDLMENYENLSIKEKDLLYKNILETNKRIGKILGIDINRSESKNININGSVDDLLNKMGISTDLSFKQTENVNPFFKSTTFPPPLIINPLENSIIPGEEIINPSRYDSDDSKTI